MKIRKFTQDDIDYLVEHCNFVSYELPLFLMRAKGVPIERIAEELDISYSYAGKISRRVNRKIIRFL